MSRYYTSFCDYLEESNVEPSEQIWACIKIPVLTKKPVAIIVLAILKQIYPPMPAEVVEQISVVVETAVAA